MEKKGTRFLNFYSHSLCLVAIKGKDVFLLFSRA